MHIFRSVTAVVVMVFSFANEASAQAETLPPFSIDSTGKVFVHQGRPVNIYMGTTPDGDGALMLKSLTPGGNPLGWDGHGPRSLTHMDLYLGRRIRFDLFADGKPPVSKTSFENNSSVQLGSKLYLGGTGLVELSAVDENAGVNAIYFSVNGGAIALYAQPFELNEEGEYKLAVYSVDNIGNREDEQLQTIVVDKTPPATTLGVEGDRHNNTLSARSFIKLTSTDATGVKTTTYRIDGGEERQYIQPLKAEFLSEGEHTVSWYSTDMVGNDEAMQSYSFYVDKTPPMVFEEILGNTYMVAGREYSSGRSQLKIAAVDNKAGVREIYYSLNNGIFKLYEKPVYLSEILGTVSVRSYALDNVNNRSQSDSQSEHFSMPSVDITGPIMGYSFKGPTLSLRDTLWIGPSASVILTAKDLGSGVNRILYKITGSIEQEYRTPFRVEREGYYHVSSTAYDNVDNLNLLGFAFGVDSKAPAIYAHFSAEPFKQMLVDSTNLPVYPKGVKLYLAATDDFAGVSRLVYSINKGKNALYGTPLDSFKSGANYSILIVAEDMLGNISEKEINFRVE